MKKQLGLPGVSRRRADAVALATREAERAIAEPAVGSKVGARRWPNWGSHPDGWGRPWSGEVLARHDPRAWHGSIAFSHLGDKLAAADTIPHVLRHWEHLRTEVPVLWAFRDAYGNEAPRVYWQKFGTGSAHDVVPYADDLQAWMIARGEARGVGVDEIAAAVG